MKFFLLASIFFLFGSTFAQPIAFEPITYQFTTENGLPSLETYSVKQDSKGFVWICTDEGVSRFDGFEFKNFTTADGLTDNVVFDTYEDFRGRIWFLTYNSLLCYYENGKIQKYKYNNKISEFVHEQIPAKFLVIDSLDNIYYSLKFLGMYKIDKQGNYKQLQSETYGYYTKLIEGNVLFSMRMDGKRYTKIGIENIPYNGEIPKGSIQSGTKSIGFCFPSAKWNLNNSYASFNNYIYNVKKDKVVYYGDDIVSFKVIDSFFWICTLDGLIKAELSEDGELKVLQHYFKGKLISSISIIDNSYFITTIGNGVFVCRDFDFLKSNSSLGLIEGSILSITKNRDQIIVSTYGELQALSSNLLIDIGVPNKTSKKLLTYKDKLIISCSNSNFKRLYCEDLNMEIICFGYSKDLKLYGDHFYWASDGVQMYNLLTDSLICVYDGWEADPSVSQRFITSIVVLPNKEILVGTNNGLYKVKNKKLVKFNVGLDKKDVTTLNYNDIWGLIIGTRDGGVYTYKSGVVSSFDMEYGLLSNKVNTVSVEGNSIYIGTSKGLNILTLKSGKVKNLIYSSNNFRSSLDINCIFIDGDWIYLGINSGLVKLRKSTLHKKMAKIVPSQVILKDILFDGEKISNSKNVNFPYNSNLLQLNFAVLQFNNWTGKKFQYRLSETSQWIDIESPSVSLFRPSGFFDVQIRYANSDLSWSKPFTLCHVEVILPFWKQWYFWTFILLGSLLSIVLIFQKSQRRIQEKLIYENQILSLEQQMQNARMNPHFIFNVLNSIHSYVLNEDTEKAEKYLMKFSKLMRDILLSTKEGTILIKQEISILTKYLELEQLRYNHSFEYEIIYNFANTTNMIPSMMIQPFIENAILYFKPMLNSEKSFIKVEFISQNDVFIEVCVSNSGIPTIEDLAKMEGASITNAIGITRSRLNNYNKLKGTHVFGIEVEVLDNTSTSILLKIPIIKNKN